jgi:hypothetical protein
VDCYGACSITSTSRSTSDGGLARPRFGCFQIDDKLELGELIGPTHYAKSRMSAAAFSSQYVMPISQYIVVAVPRCSELGRACPMVELAEAEMAVGDEGDACRVWWRAPAPAEMQPRHVVGRGITVRLGFRRGRGDIALPNPARRGREPLKTMLGDSAGFT